MTRLYQQVIRNLHHALQIKRRAITEDPRKTAHFLGSQVQYLLKDTSWLPKQYRVAAAGTVANYLIYKTKAFSLLALVWGKGQKLPIHNHKVAGAIGIVQGNETEQPYEKLDSGLFKPVGKPIIAKPGDVGLVWPDGRDWHSVANDHEETSVSLHLYAADYTNFAREKLIDGKLVGYVSKPVNPFN